MSFERTYIDKQYTLIKGEVEIYGAVSVGAAGAITFQKWNYPVMGQGTSAPARTYTAAPTAVTVAGGMSNAGTGAEGIFSVVRTGTGLWTLTLQNSHQRMVGLSFYSSLAGGVSSVVAIHENTTLSNYSSGAAGTAQKAIIGLTLLTAGSGSAAPVAGDPANGERINLRITLQDLTAP